MLNITRKLHHGKPLCTSDSRIRGLEAGCSTQSPSNDRSESSLNLEIFFPPTLLLFVSASGFLNLSPGLLTQLPLLFQLSKEPLGITANPSEGSCSAWSSYSQPLAVYPSVLGHVTMLYTQVLLHPSKFDPIGV